MTRDISKRFTIYLLMIAVVIALSTLALCLGDYSLSPHEVIHALMGQGPHFTQTVVLEWRLPRLCAAIVFGVSLALSGALFQTLTANPLGSPDVIGCAAGAHSGALIAMLFASRSVSETFSGAILGGLLSAGVIYMLAWKGGINGFRLIIIGIGITAALSAINSWLIATARLEVAMSAAIWQAGTLSNLVPRPFAISCAGCALALIVLMMIHPALRQLELGDDIARSHGIAVEWMRTMFIVIAVLLIALPAAVCGPIAFVALIAPQVAKRLVGGAGIPLISSALCGAIVLIASDLVAQHIVRGVPVGAITVIIGGAYLLVLLGKADRI